jgi:uncharacterized membrane protein SpoIIM required for sporulation
MRTTVAAVVGAILAVLGVVVVAGLIGAIGGVPIMYETGKTAYGWDGMQRAVLMLIAIFVVSGWPLPAILFAGAVVGATAAKLRRPSGR